MGISAVGAVPCKELCHHDLTLDRDTGSAGSIPGSLDTSLAGSTAIAIPGFTAVAAVRCYRHAARSVPRDGRDARRGHKAASPVPFQLQAFLLERFAVGGPSHRERMQPGSR